MNKKNINTREVQLLELEILKVLDKVCAEHSLRYYLAYGTLLGAVRHKGFIPWDDDIDLLMPRPDYEKLIGIMKKGALPQGYALGHIDDDSYIFPYAKIFKENTLVVEEKLKPPYRESMIWIDIFPMDGIPQSERIQRSIFLKTIALRKFLYTAIVDSRKVHGIEKIATVLLKPFSSLVGPHRIAKKIDRLSKKIGFAESPFSGNIAWGDGVFEKIDTASFLPSVPLTFEGEELPAPQNWNQHLQDLFGDYMQLPPEDKRESHLGEGCFIIS